jgi:hypothetical protein
MDRELPSPWKEKMELHLEQCSVCREKIQGYSRLHELLTENKSREQTAAENISDEPESIEAAKNRVWQKLQTKKQSRRHYNLWQRKLSIPLPAAAAAAIILALLTALWVRGGQTLQPIENNDRANIILAAEEEMPVFSATDLNSVLQYLGSDGTEILIMRLPESRSFLRSGDPAIIRAADYSRRYP